MVKKVKKWTGLPISVGIAPTKALAKVANRIAKKFPEQTFGVYLIDTHEKIEKALKWLPIEDVWGIGKQYSDKLKKMGVTTSYDFIQLPELWVKKHMTVLGLRLQRDLKGIPTLDLDDVIENKKSIATTRSFEKMYTNYNEVKERISSFAFSCAEKLRKQKACCHSLLVFLRTNPHRPELGTYSPSILVQLPFPTQSGIEIVKFATDALKKIFIEGYHYKKAGVILMDLVDENYLQMNILQNSDTRHKKLMAVIDNLNAKFGRQKVRLACQDLQTIWKMKQEKLSPRYTTKLAEIIQIKV